jgi:hypothetical protein
VTKRRRLFWLLAIAIPSFACAGGTEPLPHVQTPEERAAAEAATEAAARWRGLTDAFFKALRPVVGDTPLQCNGDVRQGVIPRAGQVPTASLTEWFECTMAAKAAGKSFIIVVAVQPTALFDTPGDLWMVSGVAGRADGRMSAFLFHAEYQRSMYVAFGPCERPAARAGATGWYGIRCANERKDGWVPMTTSSADERGDSLKHAAVSAPAHLPPS